MKNATTKVIILLLGIGISRETLGQNPKCTATEFWGAETNGLKAGMDVKHQSDITHQMIITPTLKSSRTNVVWLYLPPMKNRFQLDLSDDRGNPIAKTVKGRALGKILTQPFGLTIGINTRAGYTGVAPLYNQSERLSASQFPLQDYFEITNSGKYRLTLQLNVIWFPSEWKGSRKTIDVPLVSLPPVEGEIEITPFKGDSQADWDGHRGTREESR